MSEKKSSGKTDKHQCIFNELQEDHKDFKQIFKDLTDSNKQIEQYTEQSLRLSEKNHVENLEVLKLIAGKKQVPLSIFTIVVVLLSALLITREVKYSNLDIEISTNGIHVGKMK